MHLFPENITQHNCLIVIYFTSELSIIISDFILCSVGTFNRPIYSVRHINNSQCAIDTYSHPFSDFILCSVGTFNRLVYSVHHIINSQCAVDTYSHPFSHELHSSQFSFPFYSSLSPILSFLSPTLFALHITILFPFFSFFTFLYSFLCLFPS